MNYEAGWYQFPTDWVHRHVQLSQNLILDNWRERDPKSTSQLINPKRKQVNAQKQTMSIMAFIQVKIITVAGHLKVQG